MAVRLRHLLRNDIFGGEPVLETAGVLHDLVPLHDLFLFHKRRFLDGNSSEGRILYRHSSEGFLDGHWDGFLNGHWDGFLNGHSSDGFLDGHLDGLLNGHWDGFLNGHLDGLLDGRSGGLIKLVGR